MPALLEVQNLVKKFGDFAAVKGVSFTVQDGRFSLLGPNGAGKTTTISMLSTLYAPTSGDALIAGHSVTQEPMAVRQVIGVVPQDLALYEDLTRAGEPRFLGADVRTIGGKALKTARRRGAGTDRPDRQSRPARQDLLRRHEAARQHRRRAAAQAAACSSWTSRPWASTRRSAAPSWTRSRS